MNKKITKLTEINSYPKELLPYLGSIISAPIANWSDFRIEAHGIRNSVGCVLSKSQVFVLWRRWIFLNFFFVFIYRFDWLDNELWFTDNGRDNW